MYREVDCMEERVYACRGVLMREWCSAVLSLYCVVWPLCCISMSPSHRCTAEYIGMDAAEGVESWEGASPFAEEMTHHLSLIERAVSSAVTPMPCHS